MNKNTNIAKKVWAFLLAFIMVVSLIVPNGYGFVNAAEVNTYAVNLHFMNHNQTAPVTGSAGLDLTNQKMYAVVSFVKDGAVVGYGVQEVDNNAIATLNGANDTSTISVNITQFYKVESGEESARSTAFTYDDATYTPEVRIFRAGSSFTTNDKTYSQLIDVNSGNVTDNFIANGSSFPATGYTFYGNVPTSNQCDIYLNESNADTFFGINTSLSVAPSSGLFPDDGSYLILVSVEHPSNTAGGQSYYTYYLQNFAPTGTSYVISPSDIVWKDQNGNNLPYEKYTTANASNTTVKLLRVTQDDKIGHITAVQAANQEFCKNIAAGETIKGYTVSYDGITDTQDSSTGNITYTQGITLTKVAATDQYTLTDVLGDAINFGVVGKSITHLGHSETNMATYTYSNSASFACDPDLSGNGDTPVSGDYYISSFADNNVKIDRIGDKDGAIGATLYITDETKFTGAIPPNAVVKTSKDVIDAKVKGLIDKIKASSSMLYTGKTQNVYPQKIGETIQIDASGLGGTAYVDVDGSTQMGQDILTALKSNGNLQIIKDSDQLIVFNFKNVTTVEKISEISVKNGSNTYRTTTTPGKYDDSNNINANIAAQQVIWNLVGVKSVGGLSSAGGVFLMPEADSVIEANGASCGWIASAGAVNLGAGGEFHYIYRNVQSSSVPTSTGSLSLSKSQVADPNNTIAANTLFTFNVVFTPKDSNSNLSGIKFTPTTANVTKAADSYTYTVQIPLGSANAVSFTGIPDGTIYSVEEVVSSPYTFVSCTPSQGSGATVDSANTKKYTGTINVGAAATKDISFEYVNDMTGPDVNISKQTLGGTELAGASIVITRTDDDQFKFTDENVTFANTATDTNLTALQASGGASSISFKSGDTNTVLHNLPDGTYKMHEEVAPDGYLTATDITFEVRNGAVVASGTSVTAATTDGQGNVVNAKVTMVDGDAGHLTITKTIAGAALSNLNPIVFEVSGPSGFTTREITLNTTTAATTDWQKSGNTYVYTIKNVPLGTYTVTETGDGAKGSFSLKSTQVVPSGGKTTVTAQHTSDVSFTNTYEESATLTVTKSFSNDSDTVPAGDAANRKYEFTLTLKDASGNAYANKTIGLPNTPAITTDTDANGQATFKLKKDESVTISGLPVGLKYTISEAADTTAQNYGFTFAQPTAEATIASGNNTVTMTNTYKEKKTKVSVEKVWDNDSASDRPSSLSVQLKNNDSNVGTAVTLNSSNSWKYEWSDLPVYTCDENTGAWTENVYSVDEVTVPTGYNKTVTTSDITEGSTVVGTKYTITNTKSNEKVGSLEITKKVNGGDASKQAPDASSKQFTVEVTFTDGGAAYSAKNVNLTIGSSSKTVKTDSNGKITFKLKADQVATIGNIKDGVAYTVKESAASNDDKDHGYSYDSTSTGTGYTGTIDGNSNDPSAVTINNTYSEKKVDVKISKVWDDSNNSANARPTSISVQLLRNGTPIDSASVTSSGNWTKTWSNLPEYSYSSGTWTKNKYTVSETKVSRYKDPDITQPAYVNTNASGVKQFVGSITNEKDVDKGYIKLTKTIEGPVTDNDFSNLSFTVKEKNSSGTGDTYKLSEFTPVTTPSGLKYEKVIEVPDVNKTYEVTENLIDIDGTNVTVYYTVGSGTESTATVTDMKAPIADVTPNISSANATSVAIRNVYSSKSVSETISAHKTLSGETLSAGKFSFKLTETTTGSNYTETVTNAANGDVTFSSIDYTEAGTHTYTVEEIGKNDTENYEYSDKVYDVTVTVTNTKGKLSVSKVYKDGNTEVSTMEFTNTKKAPAPDTGFIDITKTITGEVTVEDLLGLSFTVTKVGETTGTTYKLSDDFNRSNNVFNLKNKITANVGDKFTITENLVRLNGITESVSYEITAGDGTKTTGNSVTSGELSVIKGKTTTVAYTNQYTKDKGYLKLTKTIKGPITDEDRAGLSFTIKDESGKEITPKSTFKLGDANDFTPNADKTYYEMTLELPVGTYSVTENLKKNDGTICTVTYKISSKTLSKDGSGTDAGFAITKGETTTVAYENDYSKKQNVYKVQISKVDATNKKEIAGAQLELFAIDSKGNQVVGGYDKKWISETSVKTFDDITAGDYAIREIVAPTGYEKVETLFKFRVTFDASGKGKVTSLGTDLPGEYDSAKDLITFENDPIKVTGKLSVHVVEEKTGRDVPNATVEVEAPDGTKKTYKTNDKGEIVDENGKTPIEVAPGSYKVTVTQVPEGYEVTTGQTATIEVPANGEARHEAKILPKTGGMKVKVVEEGTNREVPNATVEIEAPSGTTFPDGSTKIIVTTDEHGNVTGYKDKDGNTIDLTTGLTPGDYKVTVTKVPDGYKVTTGKTDTVTVKKGEVTDHLAIIGTDEKSTDTTEKKQSDTPSTEVKQPDTTTTPNAPGTPNKDKTVVDTGDRVNVVPVMIVMIISLIGIIFLIIRKRKMRYEY